MTEIALSGVIGALSYALDIAEGEPPGHAIRSCLIGMRLAAELDLDRVGPLRPLLRAPAQGRRLLGEREPHGGRCLRQMTARPRRRSKLVDWTDQRAALHVVIADGRARNGAAPARSRCCEGIRDEGEVTRKFMEARCDRGAEIARMLFLSEQTAAAIRSLDEHWDGRGMPDGLCGEEIPLAAADPVPGPDDRGVSCRSAA